METLERPFSNRIIWGNSMRSKSSFLLSLVLFVSLGACTTEDLGMFADALNQSMGDLNSQMAAQRRADEAFWAQVRADEEAAKQRAQAQREANVARGNRVSSKSRSGAVTQNSQQTIAATTQSRAGFSEFCVVHSKRFSRDQTACFEENLHQYACRYDRRKQEYYWSFVQKLSLRSSLGNCTYAASWGDKPTGATPVR